MTVDLHSADVCGRESCRGRYTYRREVGWGVEHEYAPVGERDLLSEWTRGEVALG